jgi:hypothetical protein
MSTTKSSFGVSTSIACPHGDTQYWPLEEEEEEEKEKEEGEQCRNTSLSDRAGRCGALFPYTQRESKRGRESKRVRE